MSIKATLQTHGWEEILLIIEEEKTKLCDCRNIPSGDLKLVGSHTEANKRAVELIDNIIKRIYKETEDLKPRPITYK